MDTDTLRRLHYAAAIACGVFGDFGGFADDATIQDGFISLSDRPGIGFEGQARLYKIMRELAGI